MQASESGRFPVARAPGIKAPPPPSSSSNNNGIIAAVVVLAVILLIAIVSVVVEAVIIMKQKQHDKNKTNALVMQIAKLQQSAGAGGATHSSASAKLSAATTTTQPGRVAALAAVGSAAGSASPPSSRHQTPHGQGSNSVPLTNSTQWRDGSSAAAATPSSSRSQPEGLSRALNAVNQSAAQSQAGYVPAAPAPARAALAAATTAAATAAPGSLPSPTVAPVRGHVSGPSHVHQHKTGIANVGQVHAADAWTESDIRKYSPSTADALDKAMSFTGASAAWNLDASQEKARRVDAIKKAMFLQGRVNPTLAEVLEASAPMVATQDLIKRAVAAQTAVDRSAVLQPALRFLNANQLYRAPTPAAVMSPPQDGMTPGQENYYMQIACNSPCGVGGGVVDAI
jgi:hypothetical protein